MKKDTKLYYTIILSVKFSFFLYSGSESNLLCKLSYSMGWKKIVACTITKIHWIYFQANISLISIMNI